MTGGRSAPRMSFGARFERFGGHGPSFDAIRLAAAFLVLVSHSVPIATGHGEGEWLHRWSNGEVTFGLLAVGVFFALSGFLVTLSFQRSRGVRDFAVKRALRILPAYWVVVLLSALVLGPALTVFPLKDYFAHGDFWKYLRALYFTIKHGLPGVFEGNAYPRAVNGSLWTLEYEVKAYFALGLLGVLGFLRPGRMAGVALLVIAVSAGFTLSGIVKHDLKLYSYFAAGAAFALWMNKIPFDGRLAAAAALALAAAVPAGLYSIVFPLTAPYLVLYLGLTPCVPLSRALRSGDYSYGVYLYAFPVQQIVAQFAPALPWWGNAALAAPVTLCCAIASWHLVERPALRQKGRFLSARSAQQSGKTA